MSDFDRVGDQFIDYYQTTRGHVREVLARENLSEFLGPPPATVLDIGGGDGRDTEWLATQGYEVTLVDSSALMVAKAQQRFEATDLDVKVRQLEPDTIQRILAPQQFDVVLSHGVLMYCLDEPDKHLETLAALTHVGSIVSILTKGFAGALDRVLREHDTLSVGELIEKEQSVNNLGIRVWAYKPESVHALLGKHAFELLTWRGVRVASDQDMRPWQSLTNLELQRLLEVERLIGKGESTRGMGQMLHYIARKLPA
ncbi:MAG: Methyltransferase type 12 [Candidatus Saccharibacteria bacterium]|nr:Methyltransferase type 12 [Candidatus Saccharibacteria bacterium]